MATPKTGRRRGRPDHVPTDDQRKLVELAQLTGTPHHDIAQLIGIATKTLLKHYPQELKLGKIRATIKVGGALYNSAIKGNTAAQIFWMKSQAGWREVSRLEHANADGKPFQQATATATAEVSDADDLAAYLRMVSPAG